MKLRNDWYVILTATTKKQSKVTFSCSLEIAQQIHWLMSTVVERHLQVWQEHNIFIYYSILYLCTQSMHIKLHIHIKYNTRNEVLFGNDKNRRMNKYNIIYVTCSVFIILPLLQLEVSPAHVILFNQRERVDEISHNLLTFMFLLKTHS